MSKELNKALDLLREIRPSIPKDVLELWCKDRDAFLASHKAPVEQAGGDERAAQWHECTCPKIGEKWNPAKHGKDCPVHQARASLAQPSPKCATCNDSGQIVVSGPHYQGEFQPPEYETEPCDMCAQPSPAQAEQAEAERPEVVAYLFVKPDGTLSMDAVRHKPSQPAVAVMTVAQHERIVKAWIERWKAYIELSAKIAAQRDAALARVAELDKQCRDDVARALGLRPSQERGFAWSYLLASIKSCVKASEDAAQAQHSVPEGWKLVPIEPTPEMLDARRNCEDGIDGYLVEDTEYYFPDRGAVRDFLACVYHGMLAAAPGKEGV
ncbi:hypothetical protein [Pseudomonas aeruginosa]|uniref:hypothetical protein n=1 Tax=Pseudomonas aeruginosa TaxID=287 RepID=UPI00155230C2|nr:hypothetical protein [Pseudomonas aeruginosa]